MVRKAFCNLQRRKRATYAARRRFVIPGRRGLGWQRSRLMEGIELNVRARAISAERFRLSWTSLGVADAVITTDTDGAVTFLNPAASYLTGLTLDEALGKPLQTVFVLVDRDSQRALADAASQVLQGTDTLELASPALLVSRDRTQRQIGGDAAPIRDTKEKVIGVAILFRETGDLPLKQQLVH